MFNIRLADVVFCIDNKYTYIEEMCADYICEDSADVKISVSDSEIKAENCDGDFDEGYLESLAVYRKIAEEIINFNGFLMHGAVIDVDGVGIGFLAKSGVGKSTHMALWEKCLGKRLAVVNGDKPLVRFVDGGIYAYGTPWAGKEKMQTNMRTKLKKLCFLERAEENSCTKLAKDKVLEKFFAQIYRPTDGVKIMSTLEMTEKVIGTLEFYQISCNKEISAAETAIDVLLGNGLIMQLEKNGVCMTVTEGDSMKPMLSAGDRVVIVPVKKSLKKYDVPVYRRGDHYTMHRIVKVTKNGYVICGDNRSYLERDVTDDMICGVLAGFYKGGKFIDAESDEFISCGKKAVRGFWKRKIKAIMKNFLY